MYMCICVCARTCVCVDVRSVNMLAEGQKEDVRYPALSISTLCFWDRISSLTWSQTAQQLSHSTSTDDSKAESVLGNSSALGHTQLFTWVLAPKLRSSCLHSKHCCLFSLNNVTFYCTLINNQLQALISASRSSADRRNTTAPGCSWF